LLGATRQGIVAAMPLTTRETSHLEFIRRYLAALAQGVRGEALADFFCADVVQEEFPNRLTPNGARRDLAALLAGAERGATLMREQSFEMLGAIVRDDEAAVEVQWIGELAQAVPGLPATMRARFSIWLEFRDGKIARQRNYDCFEPW
jgi:ketosteroid isomerase-like protein